MTTLSITPEEARAIAKEAYVYGYPMVDSYRIQHSYFVDTGSPEYKGSWNQIRSIPRVYTPDDKAVQTPNSDTPYSMLGMDLRAEPLVLMVPAIEENRYFSIQLIDAYTHNLGYIGSRSTGNNGGTFLVAGPNWKGEAPAGITSVIRTETEFVLAVYRTQLFAPADLDNVESVQAGYKVQPLSAFLGQQPGATAPALEFVAPLTPQGQKTSPEFFNILNFILQFCPTVASETELMNRFAKIGIGAGRTFDTDELQPDVRSAIEQGMADAWGALADLQPRLDAKEITSGDLFGTREFLKNNYLYRMAGAVVGIYGNSRMEAIYPVYFVDSQGRKLDGSHRYILRFGPGALPPVNAFWSLTMYEMPASLLVANPLNRYLLNSTMLPQFYTDADGGLSLTIQNGSPGADREANWLPAPTGLFMMVMRLYWPKDDALTGQWQPPALQRMQ